MLDCITDCIPGNPRAWPPDPQTATKMSEPRKVPSRTNPAANPNPSETWRPDRCLTQPAAPGLLHQAPGRTRPIKRLQGVWLRTPTCVLRLLRPSAFLAKVINGRWPSRGTTWRDGPNQVHLIRAMVGRVPPSVCKRRQGEVRLRARCLRGYQPGYLAGRSVAYVNPDPFSPRMISILATSRSAARRPWCSTTGWGWYSPVWPQ